MKQENQLQIREKKDIEIKDVQKWIQSFNEKPDASKVKINKLANNSKYLPISHIEALLDRYFFGRWSTRNFTFENIANELVGSLELILIHPYTNEMIVRTGVASVQIRVNKDTRKKITNALVCDVPHLKSECIKNAAKSIGKIFGRDISRKQEDVSDFEGLLKEERDKKDKDLFK